MQLRSRDGKREFFSYECPRCGNWDVWFPDARVPEGTSRCLSCKASVDGLELTGIMDSREQRLEAQAMSCIHRDLCVVGSRGPAPEE